MPAMRRFIFPAIAELGASGSFGLYFPDLPGCVTAADSLDELAANAREALQLHIEGMIEGGEAIPEPTPIGQLPHDPDVNEAGVMLVEASEGGPADAVALSLPSGLLSRIDATARARGVTRDALIAEGAEALLAAG